MAEATLFRRKEATVKAFQWFPEMGEVGGVTRSKSPSIVGFHSYEVYHVETSSGQLTTVYPGDYIVEDPVYGRTVYSKEAFENQYEAVAL